MPLQYNYWHTNMNDHPDPSFVDKLLHGISHGVDIGCRGVMSGCISPNWPSASVFEDDVTEFVMTNYNLGRVVGPWLAPPTENFICSPLGAFEKKGKVRTITDLSWPPGGSVNDHIDRDEYSVQYTTVDEAAEMCLQYEECFLAKSDIQKAYTHVVVQPKDWEKLGFKWGDYYYAWAILPFGLRSACALYDMYAEGLEYMAIKNGCLATCVHFLDDNLFLAPSRESCQNSLDIFKKTARDAGFAIQESKCQGPDRVLEFLGITIDTINKTLCISPERMKEILDELRTWLPLKSCTKRQLLSLIGKLSFISRVVRCGRTFLRRLIDLSTKVKHLHYRIKLNVQARLDIIWWLNSLATHNGVAMFPGVWNSANVLEIWTDASDAAAAGVFGESWFVIPFVGTHRWMVSMPIHWRELYAVVKCLKTYGTKIANTRIVLHVDNQVACYAINNGTTRCPQLMELVRCLYFTLVEFGLECRAEYIRSQDNIQADALSRLDYSGFRQAHPRADRVMTCPKDILYYGNLI